MYGGNLNILTGLQKIVLMQLFKKKTLEKQILIIILQGLSQRLSNLHCKQL